MTFVDSLHVGLMMWTILVWRTGHGKLLSQETLLEERLKREAEEVTEMSTEESPMTEAWLEDEVDKGPGLGFILGIFTLICTVIYIIGITYKLIKIHKGTYVEEEPIFLKYK